MTKFSSPPLRALQVFEAVIRCNKAADAARELNITESAVSHQIKSLEKWFGVPLFDRSRRSLRPSKEASRLAYVMQQSLYDIRSACKEIMNQGANSVLTISCSPAFASVVLLPSMGSFYSDHPGVEVSLHLERYFDPKIDADLFIRFADEADEDIREHQLGSVGWECVGAKSTVANYNRHKNRKRLFNESLLLEDFDDPWLEFFVNEPYSKISQEAPRLEFSEMNQVCAAAVSGSGLALIPSLLATKLCNQGLLSKISNTIIRPNSMYYYALPTESSSHKRVIQNEFLNWLKTITHSSVTPI